MYRYRRERRGIAQDVFAMRAQYYGRKVMQIISFAITVQGMNYDNAKAGG